MRHEMTWQPIDANGLAYFKKMTGLPAIIRQPVVVHGLVGYEEITATGLAITPEFSRDCYREYEVDVEPAMVAGYAAAADDATVGEMQLKVEAEFERGCVPRRC